MLSAGIGTYLYYNEFLKYKIFQNFNFKESVKTFFNKNDTVNDIVNDTEKENSVNNNLYTPNEKTKNIENINTKFLLFNRFELFSVSFSLNQVNINKKSVFFFFVFVAYFNKNKINNFLNHEKRKKYISLSKSFFISLLKKNPLKKNSSIDKNKKTLKPILNKDGKTDKSIKKDESNKKNESNKKDRKDEDDYQFIDNLENSIEPLKNNSIFSLFKKSCPLKSWIN